MRIIAKGADGWYFDNKKIDPTPEEIQAWDDQWCAHCSMGSIMSQKGSLREQCDTQTPCPRCFGTGYKDWQGKYFEYASNGKLVSASKTKLNPDSFSPYQRVTVEFDYNTPAQQDGRPPNEDYKRMLLILHIGRTVLEAMEAKGCHHP